MVCYLMAAGNGMRLRPLTNDFQKCLLPVRGKPMLRWWLDAVFAANKFDNVYVNVHHCADQVEGWITNYICETGWLPKIIDERSRLLGTAGTLFYHGDTDQDFVSIYADTFSAFAMDHMGAIVDLWRRTPDHILAGLLIFEPPKDMSVGLMTIDKNLNVTSFSEKSGTGEYAWAGVMFARRGFYDYLMETDKDLARDVLPRLIGRMSATAQVDAYDIGRGMEHYERFNGKFCASSGN